MEISKAFKITNDFRVGHSPAPSWEMCLFADVIFIDKTHEHSTPAVYQLKDTYNLADLKFANTYTGSWQDLCVFLGEMSEIDKKRKVLHLNSKQIVSFKHLIVISGKKPLTETVSHEISHALNALADAIKVNPNVDLVILSSSSFKNKSPPHTVDHTNEKPDVRVQNMIHPYFAETDKQQVHVEMDAYNERLYEIYL